MTLIHNDSQGIRYEATYGDALQLVYLGLLHGGQLDRYNYGEYGRQTVYVWAKDDEKEAIKLKIKTHFDKLED